MKITSAGRHEKIQIPTRWRVSALALLVVTLAGCSLSRPSAESQFFELQAPALPATGTPSRTALVGPLVVADYLKRNALVGRGESGRMAVASLDQWVGQLEDELQVALVKHLSSLRPDVLFLRAPGFASTNDDTPALHLDVLRFDGKSNDTVRLEANWAWVRHDGALVKQGRFSASQSARNGPAAISQAQSALVGELAKVVAAQMP